MREDYTNSKDNETLSLFSFLNLSQIHFKKYNVYLIMIVVNASLVLCISPIQHASPFINLVNHKEVVGHFLMDMFPIPADCRAKLFLIFFDELLKNCYSIISNALETYVESNIYSVFLLS